MVLCLCRYTLNVWLAYRAKGAEERKQHAIYEAQQLKRREAEKKLKLKQQADVNAANLQNGMRD